MNRTLSFIVAASISIFGWNWLVFSAFAQESSSSNFQINEYFIGSGGEVDANSANFNSRASIGDTGIDNSASTNFQQFGGFTTTDEEYLEVSVSSSLIDLGVLDASSVSTGSATFSVRNYLSSGYAVTTRGLLTSENGDTIAPMATKAASSPGTEQFGINLVANTSPSVGANVVQVPDASFSYGSAATDYDTVNQFKYNESDIIAESDKSTGQSDYTISYITNIGPLTEAGVYQMTHSLIVTPTF